MAKRRVVFGRVNRRNQGSLDRLSFGQEMNLLAELGRFEAQDGAKQWIVGDIQIDNSGAFLSGIIGFTDPETRLHFDESTDSWIKALSEKVAGASSKSVVPFAIDLRPERRWTANATSSRVHADTFRRGIELALNAARSTRGFPTDWEVDLVTSPATFDEWIESHRDIREIKRTIRPPNPGRDLTKDLEDMDALAARRKQEVYTAGYNQNLKVFDDEGHTTEAIKNLAFGTDTGQVTIEIEARVQGGTRKFKSKMSADDVYVEDFGNDWQLGIEFVLDALREYSDGRAE